VVTTLGEPVHYPRIQYMLTEIQLVSLRSLFTTLCLLLDTVFYGVVGRLRGFFFVAMQRLIICLSNIPHRYPPADRKQHPKKEQASNDLVKNNGNLI
jgi:hypothetical protein